MNLTTTQIYWLTRLPMLGDFAEVLAGLAILGIVVTAIIVVTSKSDGDTDTYAYYMCRFLLMLFVVVGLLTITARCLLPTRADLLAMFGIPALRESGILTADQIRVLDMLASGMK